MDLHSEVVELARDIIRLDTSNAFGAHDGNETLVARHLADYLGEAGIECELVARDGFDHRANLVARVRGTESGTAPSLALVGHTDVVPVDVRDWTHPPFEGLVTDDGYLWGRGAIDTKGHVAARAVAIRSWSAPVGDRVETSGSWLSPTRRTAWPMSACGGCSTPAPTSGPT
jgi:acetylornithine deacetylase/succinyl-diaminopimelate desuccinylase-like protein